MIKWRGEVVPGHGLVISDIKGPNYETKCYRNQAVNGYEHDRTTKRFGPGNGVPRDCDRDRAVAPELPCRQKQRVTENNQAIWTRQWSTKETAIVTEQPSDSDQAMEYQEAAVATE